MTDVTIIATTWLPPGKEEERKQIFETCLRSWQRNLSLDGSLHIHVADDGSLSKGTADVALKYWKRGAVSLSRQERHGVGASLNKGIEKAFERSPIVLYAVDDWELLQPLDLTPWVDFLEDPKYGAGMVRFFGHPDLTGTVKHIPPYGWAVDLDRHHYVFATRPCLWHKRMFSAHGFFEEDVSAAACERHFNEKVCASYTDISKLPAVYGPKIYLALPEVWRHTDEEESLSDITPS